MTLVETEGEAVHARFDPEVGEQQRATQHMMRSRWGRASELGLPLLCLAMLGLSVAEMGVRGTFTDGMGVWLVLIAIVFALGEPLRGIFLRRQYRKIRRENPAAWGEFAVTVSGAGLRMRAPASEVSVEWRGIVRVRETDEFFFFHFQAKSAWFLPKRVLSPEALGALRALVRRHAGERAELADG